MAQGFWDTRGIASDGEGRLRLGLPWSAMVCPEGSRTLCQRAGKVVLSVDSLNLWPLGCQTFSFPGYPLTSNLGT